MKNHNDMVLIQRYFKGEMKKEEQVVFVQRLKTEVDLAERFEFMKALKGVLLKEEEEKVREVVVDWKDTDSSDIHSI